MGDDVCQLRLRSTAATSLSLGPCQDMVVDGSIAVVEKFGQPVVAAIAFVPVIVLAFLMLLLVLFVMMVLLLFV